MRIRESCNQYNWYNLGMQAGSLGFKKLPSIHAETFEQCREYGVEPDKIAYASGFNAGLKQYCTPQSAKRIGQKGQAFLFESCTSLSTDGQLSAAHATGVAEYCATSGYQAGLSGSDLQVVCPERTRMVFNSEFQRGRTDFLAQSLKSMKAQLSQVSEELEALRTENRNLKFQNDRLEDQNSDLQREVDDLQSRIRRRN